MYKSYRLKNEATVHLIDVENTKSITVLVMYPVGSRYEPEHLRGASHYVEHLMFKGTKKRKNTLTLTREIDRLGAEYNAFTGKEYTGYYIKTDAGFSSVTLDILSDMLFASTFDAKEMEREKTVIVEEIRMYKDNPVMHIDNIFEELMFDGSKMGRDIGGTEKHIMAYKRPEVLKYRDTYYQPANMHVIVAGGLPEDIEAQVEQYFATNHKKTKLSHSFEPSKFGSKKKQHRIRIDRRPTDQAQLMLGFPGFPYGHDMNPVASVMNKILGGSMSSRLFIQIRERRGLAYMIRSGVEHFRDTGYFYVRAGLDIKNINKAIDVVKQEMKKLATKGVTPRELKDAKTHIRGALTLSLEDSSSYANWSANQILFEKAVETPDERLKHIDAVTNEQVKALAKKVFNFDEMRVAIIGNVEAKNVRF